MPKKKLQYSTIENILISDFAAEGKTIARHEGMVIFVQGAAPGDVVDLKIIGKQKKYLEAVPTRIITPSPLRVQAYCQHFGTCGGCKWQHLDYQAQLNYKQQQVVDAFQRIGKVETPEIKPIIGSANTQFYRNRLDFTFSNKKWLTDGELRNEETDQQDMNALGFHIAGRFDKVLDIEQCFHQPEPSNDIRNALRTFALDHKFTFFDLKKQEGFLRNLIIRNANSTKELMVLVQFYENNSDDIEKCMLFLKNKFPQITSLLYVVNPKRNETFHDLDIVTFDGKDHITEEMEGLKFKIGAKSFFQTNSEQAYQLYSITRNFANLSGNEVVYDLYTGTGTIANFVARQAKEVIGIEYVSMAIDDARINAKLNNITNTRFYAGDMKDILNDNFLNQHHQPDVIITDPPRAGMHEDVTRTLLKTNAKRIVYVSCNPATQARDVALLDEKYYVAALQPVDMFPHTHHVENVALLALRA